jgi:uncharacterized protein YciI
MYVVELTRKGPTHLIEAALEPHRQFLDAHYERGIFLASGPKASGDGGIILVAGCVKLPELEAILASDPLACGDLAIYRIIEFAALKSAACVSAYL